MENVEAQETQNLNLIIKTTINSKVYETLDRYFYCCSTRRKQGERIDEQKTAQSKSDIRKFFSLPEVQESKFKLPSEIVKKICNFVRFNEEGSHDFFCDFNPFKKDYFNYPETNIKELINSIDENVIVSKWYEGYHNKEEEQLLENKLALSSPQIQQQPKEGLLALMWHPDWHHNQDEMQDKIMGDYDQLCCHTDSPVM